MFYLPTIPVVSLYSFVIVYKMYKRGEFDVNDKVELYRQFSYLFEKTKEYHIHINFIFWILFFYIITI
jgi:hypothetical protein